MSQQFDPMSLETETSPEIGRSNSEDSPSEFTSAMSSREASADLKASASFEDEESSEDLDEDSDVVEEMDEPKGPSFKDFELSENVLSSLEKLGFTVPTPVQVQTIPLLLGEDTDLIALAKTGTGKTGAFGIPLIEKLEKTPVVQALVLCPTRELATQVSSNLQSFGVSKGMKVAAVVGGESYRRQIEALKRGPQIVVSTPGRLVDLMDQGIVDLSHVKYFILDEADEMLSFGFKESLETIWQALGADQSDSQEDSESKEKKVYTWLFSATMSEPIYRLTSEYLHDPVEIKLNQNQEPIKVESFAAVMYQEEKEDALSLAILAANDFYGIIFAQTKQQVAQLELKLRSFGIEVDSLHGDKVQAERTRTIKRFKSRETQILVATDVAARGLDVEDLTHVVNFELPWDAETYTHRIGRTARAGKQGIVWNFVSPKEANLLRKFEARLKTQFKPLKVPSRQDVHELIIRNWIQSVIGTEQYDREFQSLDGALKGVEAGEDISFDAKNWLAKVIKYLKIGAPVGLRSPRLLELHPARGKQSAPRSNESRGPRVRNDRYGKGFSRNEERSERSFGAPRFESRNEGGFSPRSREENRGEYRGNSRSENRGEGRFESRGEGRFESRGEGRSERRFDPKRFDGRKASEGRFSRSEFPGEGRSEGRPESRFEDRRPRTGSVRHSARSESSFQRPEGRTTERRDRSEAPRASGRTSFRDKFKNRD